MQYYCGEYFKKITKSIREEKKDYFVGSSNHYWNFAFYFLYQERSGKIEKFKS